MASESGVVTLVFYKLNKRWWKEPALNVLAAAAQFSGFCHVELAIGSESGARGEMTNVSRVFNDDVGVELAARTGLNPQYVYVQLGCSKRQEEQMLHFARSVVGMPFSNTAMARSVIWPRTSDYRSFFCAGTKKRQQKPASRPLIGIAPTAPMPRVCAELVASVLKEGGMIDALSNPGAATPQGLFDLFKNRATTTANPYLLRQGNVQRKLTTSSIVQTRYYTPPAIAPPRARSAPPPRYQRLPVGMASTARSNGPLRVLSEGTARDATPALALTFHSLGAR